MFGAFRPTVPSMGGLLWKNPWRLSGPRKMRVRQRLRAVDDVVSTVEASGVNVAALRRWREEMPTEAEMLPKDKYTTFSKQARDFRKSVHKVPKWTRLSLRTNPRGF
ncbi:putative MRPL31-mitochondrial ribosomal protein, large subunit [Acaromyces ingoldii]|uniref:Large ribosomal subunit protein mL60 n=1 Tax=Acaromyces ingoldii TaxID=215250 RepID=A0A316YXC1_9BASI|nr:putative MRPL31-mitochondrial ribosomal protein, large subunit [Acaromyces ingoldii]PWN94170.1 putative MRPL31-mitochondrial ribosomal protein, large subunit [Acaromyces ingoldii]